MDSGKKKTVIWIVTAVVMLAAVVAAVFLIISDGSDSNKPTDLVEIQTYEQLTTNVVTTEEVSTTIAELTTQAPETTTVSEEESYIENFLAEANTYTQTVEATTRKEGETVFFNVVTNGGTISDDNSLSGLTGTAKTVGEVILAAGFRYDKNQGIFYSESQSWQRNFGFMPLYDAGAALVGMYYDTIRLKFTYGEYDWMFQLWKGRYGITTGAEMGVYYKKQGLDVNAYACVPDEETIVMSYALYKGDELYMTRGAERHWWLTGFKLFDMIAPNELTMHASFFMENEEMADALEEAIIDLGFVEGINYQRLGLTMTIIWN